MLFALLMACGPNLIEIDGQIGAAECAFYDRCLGTETITHPPMCAARAKEFLQGCTVDEVAVQACLEAWQTLSCDGPAGGDPLVWAVAGSPPQVCDQALQCPPRVDARLDLALALRGAEVRPDPSVSHLVVPAAAPWSEAWKLLEAAAPPGKPFSILTRRPWPTRAGVVVTAELVIALADFEVPVVPSPELPLTVIRAGTSGFTLYQATGPLDSGLTTDPVEIPCAVEGCPITERSPFVDLQRLLTERKDACPDCTRALVLPAAELSWQTVVRTLEIARDVGPRELFADLELATELP